MSTTRTLDNQSEFAMNTWTHESWGVVVAWYEAVHGPLPSPTFERARMLARAWFRTNNPADSGLFNLVGPSESPQRQRGTEWAKQAGVGK